MKNFLQFCRETEIKLGRKLQEDEIKFMQWVFERYIEEEKNNKCIS
ncbi:hypothetical protein [Ornithinibacillus caprae]|nr:hypothetical protein [Ornithinibacillus caprae]